MKLNGRRESNNVDDRRGLKPKAAGLGIGGMVVAALLVWIFGGNPSSVLQLAGNGTTENTEYVATAEEEALAKFASQILAGNSYSQEEAEQFLDQRLYEFRDKMVGTGVAESC